MVYDNMIYWHDRPFKSRGRREHEAMKERKYNLAATPATYLTDEKYRKYVRKTTRDSRAASYDAPIQGPLTREQNLALRPAGERYAEEEDFAERDIEDQDAEEQYTEDEATDGQDA